LILYRLDILTKRVANITIIYLEDNFIIIFHYSTLLNIYYAIFFIQNLPKVKY